MRKRGIIVGIFLIGSFILRGQKFDKTDFYEADMALVSYNYERAQKIFERLLRSDPDNANLNFLNGLCLINIPGRKKESMEFLKKAVPKASEDYKYGDPQAENAPYEAIKYYALACKLNDDIPKAIELFNKYRSLLTPKEKDELALVNTMIESCYTAQALENKPIFFKKYDVGENLKSEESQLYPVVNNDETMLFYAVQNRNNKYNIFFSKKDGGAWNKPVNITTQLGAKGECYPSSVSFDNERLYLTVTTGITPDIYYSIFSKERWQKMIKMDKPINTKGWDSQAYESPDGKYLYFSSDRKGGFGNMDLYRSEKDEKGKWMKPVNLGELINTNKNELMPNISSDQSKLFFKSEAHENAGGYDIFVSEKTGDNEWGSPKNIGYPLNTTDDDIYFIPVGNGNYAYASLENPYNNNKNEIVYLEIFSHDHPRIFTISGIVKLQDEATGLDDTQIEVYNTTDYQKVLTARPESYSGSYNFEISSGSYMINYIKPDYKTYTQLVDLPANYPDNILVFNPLLERETPIAEVVAPTNVVSEVKEEDYETERPDYITDAETDTKTGTYEIQEADNIPISKRSVGKVTGYGRGTDYPGEYTIQFRASLKKIELTYIGENHKVEIQHGDDYYFRYITGVFNTLTEAENTLAEIKAIQYNDAFIRPYNLNDYLSYAARLTSTRYTIQLMALKREIEASYFKGISDLKISFGDDGFYRYTTGEFNNLKEARLEKKNLIEKGYRSAYIKKTNDVSNYHD